MAKRKCPGCGTYYLGKRCPECYYIPFDGEETAGIHDFHRDSPELVWGKTRRKTPDRKLLRPVVVILAILLVTNIGRILVSVTESVISDLSYSTPEPEPIALPEDGHVLYDDGEIRVILGWNGGEITGDIPVYLENNSNTDVVACTNGVAINGRMTDNVFFYVDTRWGTTAMSQLWIDGEELENLGITTIGEITLEMELLNGLSYELLCDPQVLSFGPGGNDAISSVAGQTLYTSEDLTLLYQGAHRDEFDQWHMRFYLQNHSGTVLDVSISALYINGEEMEQYLYQKLFPQTDCVLSQEMYHADKLLLSKPQDIQTLEFLLEVTRINEPDVQETAQISVTID